MLISKEIMRKRYESAIKIMKDKNLEAMFLIGDRQPGDELTGDLSYFTNTYIWYRHHCVLLFPDAEPVLISASWIQTQNIKRYCWIDDCRIVRSDEDVFNLIASILADKGVKSGRVGANLYYVSVAIEKFLKERLPDVELVEVHPDIMKLRLCPAPEERELIKKSAELADGAYEYILPFIKPGVTENKIRGEIDNYLYEFGATDCFTGVSAGRYSSVTGKNKSRFSYPPQAGLQKIEPGDMVWLEISPRYDGYWSQLVRYVQVSEPNPELEETHSWVLKAIEIVIKGIKPGNTIGSMCRALREEFPTHTSDYTLAHNIGHLCGLDLTDGNLLDDSEVVMTPGLSLIIHPSVLKPDGTGEIFGGETYMVTETGYERLMKSDDKIHVV